MTEKREFSVERALKEMQWERAKGELRAFISIFGSQPGGPDEHKTDLFCNIEETIEAFIKDFEASGMLDDY